MKKLLLCLSLALMGSFLHAEPTENHLKVRGVVYAWGEGEIHKLAAKLYLPKRGQGDIYIHLHDHKHGRKKSAKSLNFFVENKNGRKLFYIVFPYKTDDKVVVMRGTYTRDSRVALYAGDVFVAPKEEGLSLTPEDTTACDNFEYKGTFFFKKRVPVSE